MSRSSPAARKSLGQHFLHDQDVLDAIADAVAAKEEELVLEIGPGTGQLTEALAARYPHIVALEVDERMIRHTGRRFRDRPGVEIVHGDARDVDIEAIVEPYGTYCVAGNLPYFAANPIIRRFLERPPQPRDMVVMVQREVAKEITAPPGDFSLLTISIEVYATAEFLFAVPPEAFDPPPKVVSGVVRITPRTVPLVPAERMEAFFKLVSRTFKHPRKQVHNALERSALIPEGSAHELLGKAAIDVSLRPERLSVDDWLRLLDAVEYANA